MHSLVLFNPLIGSLSGATNSDQSGTESDGNKEVLHIPQSSSIIGASPSDCSVLYPGHFLGELYLSAEMQSVYSTTPANCASAARVVVVSELTVPNIVSEFHLDFLLRTPSLVSNEANL